MNNLYVIYKSPGSYREYYSMTHNKIYQVLEQGENWYKIHDDSDFYEIYDKKYFIKASKLAVKLYNGK